MYSFIDELVTLQQILKALSVLSTITSSPNVFIKYFVLPDILILKGFNDVKKIVSPMIYLYRPLFVVIIKT